MKKISVIFILFLLMSCSMPIERFYGIYNGVLPCFDCEKIQMRLVLNKNSTYSLQQIYFFKNNKARSFVEQGIYLVDPKNSDVIRLTKSDNLTLVLGDGYLEIADKKGQLSFNGKRYRIKKIR